MKKKPVIIPVSFFRYTVTLFGPAWIYPEGNFADNSIGRCFSVFHMNLKILYVNRINIVNRFGYFINAVFSDEAITSITLTIAITIGFK